MARAGVASWLKVCAEDEGTEEAIDTVVERPIDQSGTVPLKFSLKISGPETLSDPTKEPPIHERQLGMNTFPLLWYCFFSFELFFSLASRVPLAPEESAAVSMSMLLALRLAPPKNPTAVDSEALSSSFKSSKNLTESNNPPNFFHLGTD